MGCSSCPEFSLKIQERNATGCEILKPVDNTLDRFKMFTDGSGAKLKEVENLKAGDDFRSQVMKVFHKDKRTFNEVNQSFLSQLNSYLEGRFCDANADVVQATCITDMNSWPYGDDLDRFGHDHVQVLAKRFETTIQQARIDADQLDNEWFSLKRAIDASGRSTSWPAVNEIWQRPYQYFENC